MLLEKVGTVFLDPSGHHIICIGSNSGDVYYINISTTNSSKTRSGNNDMNKDSLVLKKPKSIPKLKALGITAVGWSCGAAAGMKTPTHVNSNNENTPTPTCTGDILLGTCTGQLIEVVINANSKDRRYVIIIILYSLCCS